MYEEDGLLKVLVTGANGFIGSHLVESLVEAGHQVNALCEYNSFASLGWLDYSRFKGSFAVTMGDVRDTEFISRAIDDIDIVFHLAALIAIPYSYIAPRSYLDVNNLGTLNVLEAVRRSGSKLVHASTSEVYGTPETTPITENHKLLPQSPYAASKASADLLVQSYSRSFEVKSLIIRPFNTYGPRQSARAVIPTIMAQALASDSISLGSLHPQRDLTYVLDTVAAFEATIQRDYLFDGRVIQLGYGATVSIGELVKIISEVIGKPLQTMTESIRVRPKDSEVNVLLSDPTRARDSLDWKAQVTLKDGLLKTWEWIKQNKETYLKYTGYVR